jgi:hypothetical protein
MREKLILLFLSLVLIVGCKPLYSQPTSCAQLLTYYDAQRSSYGIMFDVEAREDIAITFIDNYFIAPGHVAVYYRYGTHKGFDSLEDWSLIDTFWHSNFTFSRLPFPISKFLGKGQRMAFFIQTNRLQGIGCRDILTQDTVVAQDSFLKILEGSEVDTSMVQTAGQAFVGSVHYCPAKQDVCVSDRLPNYSNFRDGAFTFDLKATRNITISQVGVEITKGTGQVTLYSKSGSYRGTELDSAQWTPQASVAVPVLPTKDSAIMVPLPLPMDIDSGNTVAFYFSGAPQSLLFVWISDTLNAYYSTGLYDLYPGIALYSRFNIREYPAMWIPRLDLCWRNSVIFPSGLGSAAQLLLSAFPNPANDILNITTEEHEPVTLDIIDMQGRAVITASFLGSATLDVAQLPASVYQLYLHNANGIAVKRFVKN